MAKGRKPKTMILRSEQQRRAFASPFRMELIGQFLDGEPLSVAQLAERLGRSATALHYHVGVLEKAGIMKRAGTRRVGRRSEALFMPAADVFKMEQQRDDPSAADTALKTLATAFRMAEGDLRAALENPRSKSRGPHRNVYGVRLHCRLSKKDLAQLNRHLRAIEKMLSQTQKNHEPSPGDEFVSLTLALMPLRNREVQS